MQALTKQRTNRCSVCSGEGVPMALVLEKVVHEATKEYADKEYVQHAMIAVTYYRFML